MYRGTSDFKKNYRIRSNIVKIKKGDFVSDSHNILAWLRKYFSRLLKVHGINDVRQTLTLTAEPIVPEPSAFDVELAIEK